MADSTRKPVHRKVKAVGLSGAIATILVVLLSLLNVDLDETQVTLIVSAILTIVGYRTKS